jgi:DNA (cytosine-5)-methyltransferase 1
MDNLTAVDIFCGCGGVTEGLKRSNFHVIAAIDKNPIACKTYKENHPDVKLYEQDIKTINVKEIYKKCFLKKCLDLLVVCAPCQPFSSQNKTQHTMGDQLKLILNAIEFAKVFQPNLIFFENVPGITRGKFKYIIENLNDQLKSNGYIVGEPQIVDAADYAVPQRRKRTIMFAAKGCNMPVLPVPITPEGRRITVQNAIGNLPILHSNEADVTDPLHHARKHRPIALDRLAHIPKNGGSRDSLPDYLILKCHRDYKGHPDVYGRMCWGDVAPTLTTGCIDITRGRFAHPSEDRAITLREAARLQTFPDNYQFSGSYSDIATQIGNAVPVRLIESLSPAIINALRN